ASARRTGAPSYGAGGSAACAELLRCCARWAGNLRAHRTVCICAAWIGAAYASHARHDGVRGVTGGGLSKALALRHTEAMRVLVVGAGGVGAAFASIAQHRSAFKHISLADVSASRVHHVVAQLGEADRFSAERVDASDRAALVALIGRLRPDAVLNACDPRF